MNYSTNAVPQTQTIRVGGIIQNASRPLKRERNLLPSSWLPVSLTLATASLLLYLRKTTGSASSQVRSCACVTLSTYSSLFLSNDKGCGQGRYMPFFEWKDHCTPDKLKAVMHELRQACIRAILDVIEGCGQHGFECLLWEDTHKGKKQNK